MATEAQLLAGLKAADAAGNTADAQHFADQIKALRAASAQSQGPSPSAPSYTAPTASNRADAFIRAVTQGLMFNLGDEANAAKNATIAPLLGDKASQAPGWYQRYQENLAHERGLEKANSKEYPLTTAAGNVAGVIPLGTMMKVPQTAYEAAVQGGRLGAAYGFGEGEGDLNNRVASAAINAPIGAATAGVISKIGNGLVPNTTGPAASLRNAGVEPTVGQNIGGTAKRLEEGMTSIPVVGDAIRAAQLRALQSFNRAAYDRVLSPLGASYPKNAPVGNAGIDALHKTIGKAYDDAFNGATLFNSPDLNNDISTAVSNAASTLPKERVDLITQNINNRLLGKFGNGNAITGDDLVNAKNWFAEQSRAGSSASQDERNIADAYGNVLDALKSEIARNDPIRGQKLAAADNAMANFVRVGGAAATANAAKHEGVFTADQLANAVRSSDLSQRKLNYAKGDALLQDLSQDGQQVLAKEVPDSGTPYRHLVQLLAGTGIAGGAGFQPEVMAGLAGAGLAGHAAYSPAGQRVLNSLVTGAPQTRAAIGAELQKVAPLSSLIPLSLVGQTQ